ncbi:hypothetical protein SAMN05428961_11364 [Paenibacillus sp. OK060]|nr:hypothetical protein SAMN05428961_11364 [Paenibacillus sp. OK060]
MSSRHGKTTFYIALKEKIHILELKLISEVILYSNKVLSFKNPMVITLREIII